MPKSQPSIPKQPPVSRADVLAPSTPVNPHTSTPADQPAKVNSQYPTVSYRIDPAVAKRMRLLSVQLDREIGNLVQEAFTRLLEHYNA